MLPGQRRRRTARSSTRTALRCPASGVTMTGQEHVTGGDGAYTAAGRRIPAACSPRGTAACPEPSAAGARSTRTPARGSGRCPAASSSCFLLSLACWHHSYGIVRTDGQPWPFEASCSVSCR